MKKISLYDFYYFGTCQRYLQDADKTYSVRLKSRGGALDNIDHFEKFLKDFGLTVTKRVAELKLEPIKVELGEVGADEETRLTEDQADRIREAMREIRTTLDAEIEGVFVYLTTPKRLDTQKLLEDISGLFSPDVYNSLPEIARFDLSESGKCLAFERPTAAAFHLLRATEAVLRFYYEKMVAQNRIKSEAWGHIVDDLRKRAKTKKYEALNNHLDHIRNSFRNPTQHPDAKFDINEAQDIWGICVDVINRLVKILKENKKI